MSNFPKIFQNVNAEGYAPGETPDSFRRVHANTLRFVMENARTPARRHLAQDELQRRGLI